MLNKLLLNRIEEDTMLRLPQSCDILSGNAVRLHPSLYSLKQASCLWHSHLDTPMKTLRFEHCTVDAGVLQLVEDSVVSVIAVIHADTILAVSIGRRVCVSAFVLI